MGFSRNISPAMEQRRGRRPARIIVAHVKTLGDGVILGDVDVDVPAEEGEDGQRRPAPVEPPPG